MGESRRKRERQSKPSQPTGGSLTSEPEQVQRADPETTRSSPKKKRITFDISPELHAKAFIHARRQGTTIKDLLTGFLERETVNEKI